MTAQFRIVAAPHPFRMEVVEAEAPEGLTIAEAIGPASETGHFAVQLEGVPIGKDQWICVKPKAGELLVVKAIPEKKFLGVILQIGLMIAAAFIAPYLAPAVGAALGLSTALATTLVTGVISLLGGLLINALIPPPKLPGPSGGSTGFTQLNSITGVQNQTTPFGPIPRLYGTVRYFPPIPVTATPYTELSGNDQFLRMFLCLGYGPTLQIGGLTAGAGAVIRQNSVGLAHDAIKIGDTSILDFEEVEFEIGAPEDLTLYTNEIDEEGLSVTLDCSNTDPFEAGDDTNDNATFVDTATGTRTTQEETDEGSVDIVFPQGLWTSSKKGEIGVARVTFKIEYRPVGTLSWTILDASWQIESKKRETLRVGKRWKFPANGQYDVRVTRVSTYIQEGNAGAITATWSALRSIHYHQAFIVPNTVCMAARIKATDQLQSVISTLSIEATSILPVWNGSAWVDQATNSAAWAYVDALTGVATPRAGSKSDIDADAMVEWAAWLSANGFTFNKVYDSQGTVFEVAQEIAASGLAAYAWVDGKDTVVRDVPDNVPRALITPRNSFDFSWSRQFVDMPHALRVRFTDPETWETTERLVYADGYSELTATKFETLDVPGCTNADQAWKMGRYHLAQGKLRSETYEFSQDFEHLIYQRGDLVHLSHDVIAVGLGFARVTDVHDDGSFDLDDEVDMEASKAYAVVVRQIDHSQPDRPVVTVIGPKQVETVAGTTQTLTPVHSLSGLSAGDLVSWGELGAEVLPVKITGIRPEANLSATMTAVPAALDIFDAWTGDIPEWDPATGKIDTGDLAPGLPEIVSIRSDETVQPRDNLGAARPRMVVAFKVPAGTPAETIEVQAKPSSTSGAWVLAQVTSGTGFVALTNVERGVQYDLQARARRRNKTSPWSVVQTHTVSMFTAQIDTENLASGAASGTQKTTWTGPVSLGGSWVNTAVVNDMTILSLTDTVLAYIRATLSVTTAIADSMDVRARVIDGAANVVVDEATLVPGNDASAANTYTFKSASAVPLDPVTDGFNDFTLQLKNFGSASVSLATATLTIQDIRA